jgi:MarR family transcriptional regulator, temperature-dependent positive regulator of motility
MPSAHRAKRRPSQRPAQPTVGRGGDAADFRTGMLDSNELTFAWRLNYIASFYSVPFYLALEQRIGISRPEYVILFCVIHRPGVTAGEIVAATGRPKNSISFAVTRLEKKGLIVRRPNHADSRRMELRATGPGRATYHRILPFLQERERRLLAPLSAKERERLGSLLMKIALNVPEWEAPELSALVQEPVSFR